MTLTLHGYRYSVYTRAARLALHHSNQPYEYVEFDPFDPTSDFASHPHPFGRVPVLIDDAEERLIVYETAAITRYITEKFAPSALASDDPAIRAHSDMVVGVIDSYGYRPMVRQVFSHGYWRAKTGETPDPSVLAEGLEVSVRVLDALEDIASQGRVLNGRLTLADCHLAPMVAAFVLVPEAASMLAKRTALSAWWEKTVDSPAMLATDPGYVAD